MGFEPGTHDNIIVVRKVLSLTSCGSVPLQATVTEGSAIANSDNTESTVNTGLSTLAPKPQIISGQLSKDVYDSRIWQVSIAKVHSSKAVANNGFSALTDQESLIVARVTCCTQ